MNRKMVGSGVFHFGSVQVRSVLNVLSFSHYGPESGETKGTLKRAVGKGTWLAWFFSVFVVKGC
ncbi:MAG: hypothetical protein NZU63_09290 [Gemmataceae bacterium]|nr:hypothetical protein [Gemmataceae bacterium]MDW8242845.1 hypothetical protein [Thermogemmata sp.]